IPDVPTLVVLSTTGRAVRIDLPDGAEPPAAPTRRSKHDAILSTVHGTTRGELGAITSRGRLIRFTPVDLPSVPANSVQLAAGAPARLPPPPRPEGAWARPRVARLRASDHARHPPGRRQARRAGRLPEPARFRGDRAQAGRRARGCSPQPRRRRARLRDLGCAAAALRRLGGRTPGGRRGRPW